MLDFYGSHFEYAGVYSRQYGVIFANVSTERNVLLGDTISANTLFNRKGIRNYYLNDDRSESPIEFDVEFISDRDEPFEINELRKIEKWLFNTPGYSKLYLDMANDCFGETVEYINGEQKRLYLNCRFINPERIEGNGGVFGIKATMQCDSGMAWQDAAVYKYTLTNNSSSSNSTVDVVVDTDLKDYIYPKVTIQMNSGGGDVIITNLTDNESMGSPRLTKFVGVGTLASVIMNGETNYISGDYYSKFVNRNFIRLRDGVNKISVTGNVDSVTFEFSNRRWI